MRIYGFGTRLLEHIVPKNDQHKTVCYEVKDTGNNSASAITINAAVAVEYLLNFREKALQATAPDKVITLGGSCLVSLTPFEYLRHKYDDLGIICLDAHPDASAQRWLPQLSRYDFEKPYGRWRSRACAPCSKPLS